MTKTNMEIKKPYAAGQYNKFIKSVDKADQYLGFNSDLRKTVKWSKKVVLHLLNCVVFDAFVCVECTKYKLDDTKRRHCCFHTATVIRMGQHFIL